MFTFFEGPEPSDGLRMKKVSSISSTDWDMIAGKASSDGGTLDGDLFHGNRTQGDFTSGVSL
jgi:hypothetical protein